MSAVLGFLRGLWLLFFDDPLLGTGLMAWAALLGLALPLAGLARIGGPLLFFGCGLILAASVAFAARKLRR